MINPTTLDPLEGLPQEMLGALEAMRQGGQLSRRLPGYQERPAQIAMAAAVVEALSRRVHAVLEAGTGVGKSYAYLGPLAYSDQVAVISTANITLQEQIFYKDLPFVQKHIRPVTASLVKGMNHYVCVERFKQAQREIKLFDADPDVKGLADLIKDPDFLGDFETLGFALPLEIRSLVDAQRDLCAGSQCPSFSACYVRQMRERAGQAHIVVTNHALLLLDIALGGSRLLPRHEVVVLDEAHHLEEEATRAFTTAVHLGRIESLFALRLFQAHTTQSLREQAGQLALRVWSALEQMLGDRSGHERVRLERPLEAGMHLASIMEQLAAEVEQRCQRENTSAQDALLGRMLHRTQALAEALRQVFSVAPPTKEHAEAYVYYIERLTGAHGPVVQAVAAPLDVAPWLRAHLFEKWTVIATSATLASTEMTSSREHTAHPTFSYFRRRVGLDPEAFPGTIERILPLAFDYQRRSLLYIPRPTVVPVPAFGATPRARTYVQALAGQMRQLIAASGGRAFLLFSSKRTLDEVYHLLAPDLAYPLLRQGDQGRAALIAQFKQRASVLLGLRSYWEGVDIPGEALSLVVIDRLPFDPPFDPVQEARQALLKEAGGDGFGQLVLPETTLRLKQGMGRLLRRHEDWGAIAILDPRLWTKSYASLILACLPPSPITDRLEDVQALFEKGIEDDQQAGK